MFFPSMEATLLLTSITSTPTIIKLGSLDMHFVDVVRQVQSPQAAAGGDGHWLEIGTSNWVKMADIYRESR